ncbi:MAG: hypothetical protein A2622_13940 [Bdellovibrionales bacterium RIFCSPHIGHO2_01_FULL_40_29]|nr:MAG: hypothetical protein A2622_13940 [Bdellovibrionales bacterium RIFCSPHIGHO2_01_FULL_40_29]OFZ33622.1 MAG: hypothetical protein A3D17_11550 [Bdellovibrionales bacterium RIFCSPHIGHO2_02_FULL_40_15]
MAQNKLIFTILVLLLSLSSNAVEIQFPQEELPNESFPPQLDSPQAVISRKLTFTKRFEPQVSYGWLLDEPFYQSGYVAAGLGYSWSEFHNITVRYLSWNKGLSDYSNQFASTNARLQFDRSHGPESGYSLAYHNRFLYGKVSFSKNWITPITLSAIYEGGMINYGGKTLPFGGVGLGNAWYFSKNWSFDIGIRIYLRQVLDPLSADLRAALPVPAESSFGTTMRVSTNLNLGIQYLF